jgi:hypothetical protein
MLGKHPLSKIQGQPIKELMREVKRSDIYKNRESEKEEILRKCHEIYAPPGLITVAETSFGKSCTLP